MWYIFGRIEGMQSVEMGSKENWTIEVSVWGNLEDPGDYERRERISGKLGY